MDKPCCKWNLLISFMGDKEKRNAALSMVTETNYACGFIQTQKSC